MIQKCHVQWRKKNIQNGWPAQIKAIGRQAKSQESTSRSSAAELSLAELQKSG
jgi:hypothetical protein